MSVGRKIESFDYLIMISPLSHQYLTIISPRSLNYLTIISSLSRFFSQ